jgi:hypothetical protein
VTIWKIEGWLIIYYLSDIDISFKCSLEFKFNDQLCMRKNMILGYIFVLVCSCATLRSQDLTIRETINNIDTLLKTYPYYDSFNEIAFYYSVDITSKNELVVIMESAGAFKTIFKTKISDLEHSGQKDSCNEEPDCISWHCKSDEKTKNDGCVYVTGTIPGGIEANYYQNNISVMFSRKALICNKLYKAFNDLFTKVLESEIKK